MRKGRPLTFREGSIQITPYKSDGTVDTAKAIYVITSSGSVEDTVEMAEADANCVGKIRAAGARSVTIEASAFVADAGGANATAGTKLEFKSGDLAQVDLKAGLLHYQGEFFLSKISSSFDAADFVTLDLTFDSNGEPTISEQGVVTCVSANGTTP